MTFAQAIAYFLREASVSLFRSWKVSLLAISTITMSLFLGGSFLLVSGNLRSMIDSWKSESAIAIYLEEDSTSDDLTRLEQMLGKARWVSKVVVVTPSMAHQRFSRAFPSLVDLLEGWGEDPLPASLEVYLDPNRQRDPQALATWFTDLGKDPAVVMVDDDRDWLNQLEAVVFALEALGTLLGVILLTTAVFTISSVIRLTAYLYREEIAVMRMVGATEFFIRGPFYLEGMLQGLTGGLLASGALAGAYALVLNRYADSALALLATEFLGATELLALVILGGLAGLVGAVTSLRRESLGRTAEAPGWEED